MNTNNVPMQLSSIASEILFGCISLLIAKSGSCMESGFIDWSLFISNNEKYFNASNRE